MYNKKSYAPVAQLDRALVFGTKGRGFDSLLAHHDIIHDMKERTKAAISELGLLYCVIAWGSTFFIIKDILPLITPLQLIGYRYLFAGLLAGAILFVQRKNPFKNWKEGFMLGLMIFFINAPQTLGLKFTSASNSAFITGLFVIFVPVFTYLFTKRMPSPKRLIPIGLALMGLWVLTGGIHGINLGDLLTLITAMVVGLQIVSVERILQKGADPFILLFQQFAITAILAFILEIIIGNGNIPALDQRTIWPVIYLAVIGTFFPLLIQFFAQKHVNTIKVSLYFSLEPLFALLFACMFGQELFIPERTIGGLLIVVAIILSEIIEKKIEKAI